MEMECACSRRTFFARTGMGQSMAEAKVDHEPPDGAFDHPISGRRYRVYREGGRLCSLDAPEVRNGIRVDRLEESGKAPELWL